MTREEAIKALVDGKIVIAKDNYGQWYVKFQAGRFTYSSSINDSNFCGDFEFRDYYSYEIYEEPKKKKTKRFWIWDVKYDLDSAIYKSDSYMDENAMRTNGNIFLSKSELLKKHENEFIDIEVEE